MHKACRRSFHARDSAIQNQRSRLNRSGPLLLSLVDGNLLPKGKIFQHNCVVTFSEQPNQTKQPQQSVQHVARLFLANALKSQRCSGDLILTNHTLLPALAKLAGQVGHVSSLELMVTVVQVPPAEIP